MYENDEELEWPYDTKLSSLIHDQAFREILKPSIFREINLIRKIGNDAAHGNKITQDQSIVCLKHLFRFLSYIGIYYGRESIENPSFSIHYLPDGKGQKETQRQLEILQEQLALRKEKDDQERTKIEAQAEEITKLKEQLLAQQKENKARRQEREKEKDVDRYIPTQIPESVTRKLYIDSLLREAGWSDFSEGYGIEYEVKGMPLSTNPSGLGYVDYVLWGKDGIPLAVVEAKSTMKDARKGRHQAELYANCIENMHGRRPVIFYTNGFETYLWDDVFAVDREVQGFYTRTELELIMERRKTRKDPRLYKVNLDIAGRSYQLEALKRIAESFATTGADGQLRAASRESLLVMATGSGKTRTAAALVDMLTKCNWAKRVLFLADRNALVTQAKNAFKEHLPELSAIDLTKEKEDGNTRIVFSTYPTIINKIDRVRTDDERFYGVGHFDLIIIDEAHRSIYQKYRAIFEYFDSLLIGLTATPKKDIDRNTYSLFGIEDDIPTFAYELTKAVKDGYLVPPKAISVPLKFQREGIKYAELSDAEKEEYEEKFGDPSNAEAPDAISNAALNKWLFNKDTVDKVLDYLMKEGIKVAGGDRLGKTIIFAKNHDHAIFVEERFNKNYPEYGGKFLRVIDNYESKAQSLLEKFTDTFVEQDPQIAVSVDMMDTGVDAPRVVNLVFFKMVKSSSKFWQMIGRGTRLCPNLFQPGVDKKEFLIFDYCQNFEFFDEYPDGVTAKNQKPLLQQIFEAKLKVTTLVTELESASESDLLLRHNYLYELYQIIKSLDKERFVVRKELRYVEEYCNKNKWFNLTKSDLQEINTHLSYLQPVDKTDDELARRFDMLILMYQLALLSGKKETGKFMDKVFRTASSLEKKENIPQISLQLPLIKEIQSERFWNEVDAKKLDDVRLALRELIKYLDRERQLPIYTNFEDDLDVDGVEVREPISSYESLTSYKERVEAIIRKNKNHLTVHKLKNNLPITSAELEEIERILFENGESKREMYEENYGDKPLGELIRNVVGLDSNAVDKAFVDFLQSGELNASQITFVRMIMDYFTHNGFLNKLDLYEAPFTDLNDQSLNGIFDNAKVISLVQIIDSINSNAVAN